MNIEQLPFEPDWSKYAAGLWGYAGVDRNRVTACTRLPATRARIGHRGLYKPGFCQLANGDLLASPCYTADDKRWHMKIYRSADNADSWQLVDTSGAELLGKEPALTALSSGSVLLVTSHPHNFRIHRSVNGGQTWTVTELTDEYSTFRTVLEDESGVLSMFVCNSVYFDPSAPPVTAAILRSTDDGQSWTKHADIPQWDHPVGTFDEGHAIRLEDGRLLCTGRVWGDIPIEGIAPPRGIPTPAGDETGDYMIMMESTDDGHSWTKPVALTDYAQPHGHLLKLQDGRLLCCYANYNVPFGPVAMFSDDDGKTWDKKNTVQLAVSLNLYAGWPTSIQLDNGEIITTYAIAAYLEGEGEPGKGDQVAESIRWIPPPAIA